MDEGRKEYTNLSNAECFALDTCSKGDFFFFFNYPGLTIFHTKNSI